MNKTNSEQILDSFLSERLGQEVAKPIDLKSLQTRAVDPQNSERLTQAVHAASQKWPATIQSNFDSRLSVSSKRSRVFGAGKHAQRGKRRKPTIWNRTLYLLSGVAAGAILAVGSWSLLPSSFMHSFVVNGPDKSVVASTSSDEVSVKEKQSGDAQLSKQLPDYRIAEFSPGDSEQNDTSSTKLVDAVELVPSDSKASGSSPEILSMEQLPFTKSLAIGDGSIESRQLMGDLPKPWMTSSEVLLDSSDLVALVDDQMEYMWNRRKVIAASSIPDEQWIERASIRITGKPLSEQDKESFLADKADNRRENWLDQVTSRDDFYRFWTSRFTDAILPNAQSLEPAISNPSRTRFKQWIAARLRDSTPLDQIVQEILVAQGDLTPGTSAGSPQAYWWAENAANNDHSRATSGIASNLLGQRGSCIRCHDSNVIAASDVKPDSPTPSFSPRGSASRSRPQALTRSDYWNLALVVSGIDVSVTELDPSSVDTQTTEETNKRSVGYNKSWNALFYEQADRSLVAAQSKLPNGMELISPTDKREGSTESENSTESIEKNLQQLGKWLTSTPSFDERQVNWVWESIFGQPLQTRYTLADSDGLVERRELLEALGAQFRRSQFDLRKLVKVLALTKAFNRQVVQSDPVWYITSTPQELSEYQNRQRLFASYSASMDPSFRSIANVTTWFRKSHNSVLGQLNTQQPKLQNSADLIAKEQTTPQVTSAQTQFIVRSRVLPTGLSSEVDRWLKSSMRWEDLVDHAFYLSDDTAATKEEQSSARELLSSTRDRRQAIHRILASQLP